MFHDPMLEIEFQELCICMQDIWSHTFHLPKTDRSKADEKKRVLKLVCPDLVDQQRIHKSVKREQRRKESSTNNWWHEEATRPSLVSTLLFATTFPSICSLLTPSVKERERERGKERENYCSRCCDHPMPSMVLQMSTNSDQVSRPGNGTCPPLSPPLDSFDTNVQQSTNSGTRHSSVSSLSFPSSFFHLSISFPLLIKFPLSLSFSFFLSPFHILSQLSINEGEPRDFLSLPLHTFFLSPSAQDTSCPSFPLHTSAARILLSFCSSSPPFSPPLPFPLSLFSSLSLCSSSSSASLFKRKSVASSLFSSE